MTDTSVVVLRVAADGRHNKINSASHYSVDR